ncbi:MAG: polysaccharide biosynthesis/export family protein [Verrucomicrobia bacterium]|nr:polysaccharide biosynthesis/export family protein [Verrucomicrobiota bacterium]
MNAKLTKWVLAVAVGVTCQSAADAGVEIGDSLKLTIRGVPNDEQQQVNGTYRVGETGALRLPLLTERLPVRGLSADEIATAAENAYRSAGIYKKPTIEVEVISGPDQREGAAVVSVGGQVGRAGGVPYRKGLTLMQALHAAGDRNAFGGRNINVFRGKKVIRLDYRKAEHKNFELLPEDSIIVDPKGAFEFDRG